MTTIYAESISQEFSAPAASSSVADWALSSLFAALVVTIAASQSEAKNWVFIPLFFCGVLSSVDAIAWLRRKVDLFDPVGLVGLMSVHFYFLAPILHLVWNEWMAYVKPLSNWDEWVGWMGVVNVCGLLIYRAFRSLSYGPVHGSGGNATFRVANTMFWPLLWGGLATTLVAQVLVYWSFGGLSGYINAFEHVQSQFLGMGWVFMISESFPILCMIGFAMYQTSQGRRTPWPVLAVVLLVFFALAMMFGGLRGSRMNTLWGLFWAVGIIHYLIRPVPRSAIFAGGLAILLFLYAYGFYKARGLAGLEALSDMGSRAKLQRTYGRTLDALLLGDLSRADVQAYVLRQTCAKESTYEWGWGQTYLGTAALLIPRQVWANRPADKVVYGTKALYGEGARGRASNVYGLAGEAMLNFGPVGALVSFAVFGLLVRRMRTWINGLAPGDIRGMLAPFVTSLCVCALVSDSDNVLFILVKQGAIPILLVYFGSWAMRANQSDVTPIPTT